MVMKKIAAFSLRLAVTAGVVGTAVIVIWQLCYLLKMAGDVGFLSGFSPTSSLWPWR
jgi:hypothetical protein